MCTYIKHSI